MKRTVDEIRESVKSVLDSEGLYSPIFDLSIENLAQISFMKSIAFEDATVGFGNDLSDSEEDGGGRSVVFERSREGDRRYKVNPAYTAFIDLERESQRILDSLCMTAKSSNATQADDFEELRVKMEQASNGQG